MQAFHTPKKLDLILKSIRSAGSDGVISIAQAYTLLVKAPHMQVQFYIPNTKKQLRIQHCVSFGVLITQSESALRHLSPAQGSIPIVLSHSTRHDGI